MPCASIMGASAATVPRPERAGLATRLAAAAVLAPLAIAVAWVGGAVWVYAVAIVTVVALWEWSRMVDGGRLGQAGWPVIAAAAAVPVAIYGDSRIALAIIAFCGVGAAVVTTKRRDLGCAIWMAGGAIYIVTAAWSFAWLRVAPGAGLGAVLWLLFAVWASDAAAYAAGRLIGGPRLAPRVSPNKTWAGLLGAMLGASVVSGVFGAIWPRSPDPLLLGVAGLGIGLVGQGGDLLESVAKRRFGTKDSGTLIPGHGGVLDRIDALMAVTLAAALVYLSGQQELTWS